MAFGGCPFFEESIMPCTHCRMPGFSVLMSGFFSKDALSAASFAGSAFESPAQPASATDKTTTTIQIGFIDLTPSKRQVACATCPNFLSGSNPTCYS